MTRARSALRGLVIAIGMLLVAIIPTPALAKPDPAVTSFGGCLVGAKAGDLLILMDESASLVLPPPGSDPTDARVDAANLLIDRLSDFAVQGEIVLDVAVSTFAVDYTGGGWTTLDGSGRKTVRTKINNLADRDDGWETDYYMALDGARAALAAKAEKAKRCQAIVWFSDGKLSLDIRSTAQERKDYGTQKPYAPEIEITTAGARDEAQAKAAEGICNARGLADQLRSAKVTMFAIGLAGSTTKDDEFDLMRNIATGSGACGKITRPTPGTFTRASGVGDLALAFNGLLGPIEETIGICREVPCPDRQSFVLDDSLAQVDLLAVPDVVGLDVYLQPPGGSPLKLKTAGQTVDKVAVTLGRIQDAAITIKMVRPAKSSWTGLWSVIFVDPRKDSEGKRVRTQLTLRGDLVPTWPSATTAPLRAGDNAQVTLGLARANGVRVDPTGLRSTASITAVLTTADGTEIPVATGLAVKSLSRPLRLDLRQVQSGSATLTLTLSVTTASATNAAGKTIAGTRLDDAVVSIPVTIAPAPGFPAIDSDVYFGRLDQATSASSTAGINGSGCVWLETSKPMAVNAAPIDAGAVSVTSTATSAQSCVQVTEGQSGQLPLTFTASAKANGTVSGVITVMRAPTGQLDRAEAVEITIHADMYRPFSSVVIGLAFAIALILALGIPLGLLYLSKWWTARIPAEALLARKLRIVIDQGRVLVDGRPLNLSDTENLRDQVPLTTRGSRDTQAVGVRLRTRIGASPLTQGYVEASCQGRIAVGPDGRTFRLGTARLPLAVHHQWMALIDPGQTEQAEVVLLLGLYGPAARRQRMIDEISSRLPAIVGRLGGQSGEPRASSAGSPPTAAASGSGDGGSTASDGWTFGSATTRSADDWSIPGPTPGSPSTSPPHAPPDPPTSPPADRPDELGDWDFGPRR